MDGRPEGDVLMADMKKSSVALRPMLPSDGPDLAAIFIASIEELTGDDYTPGQQTAWASAADDASAFTARLQAHLTLVAGLAGQSIGFAALKAPDHIEMLYVHPDGVGQGVGTALCEALERLARARGVAAMTVDASDTAQDFFAKRGFVPQLRQTIALGDEWLGRTTMKKALGQTSGHSS